MHRASFAVNHHDMNRFALLLATAITLRLAPTTSLAGGEEVVVIYNSRVTASKKLAEYYATQRQVPKSQVFGFDLPDNENMSRADYQDKLEKSLAKKLESAKLWRIGTLTLPATNGTTTRIENRVVESKIRYAVICFGVPLRILPDANLHEPAAMRMRPELRRNEAAVDSELACLPLLKTEYPRVGLMNNPVYGATNAAWIHPTNGVLLVARLDGPTPEIARRLVDQAHLAEQDGLWGRAYIDLRNTSEPGLKQGDDWVRTAGEVCKTVGFETVTDQTGSLFPAGFPMSQIAFYAGWYSEHVIGAFDLPTVEFMPGAFAYHLHSFSAASLRSTNRNWLGPLLAKGVTATMGTVNEPYLGGTPDIGTFAARFLYFGMTFGEAACAGQSVLSWQTTVVGDPLYRPFGKPPRQVHEELEARQSKLIEWSHLRVANLNLARGGNAAETVTYLEDVAVTKRSAVLSERLGDLYGVQGKPTAAATAYEQALSCEPSPLQRLRLRLSLGEKLTALNRDEDAFTNYEKLLEEHHALPDKLPTYRKLLALAQKLGKAEAVVKYEERVKTLTMPPATKP